MFQCWAPPAEKATCFLKILGRNPLCKPIDVGFSCHSHIPWAEPIFLNAQKTKQKKTGCAIIRMQFAWEGWSSTSAKRTATKGVPCLDWAFFRGCLEAVFDLCRLHSESRASANLATEPPGHNLDPEFMTPRLFSLGPVFQGIRTTLVGNNRVFFRPPGFWNPGALPFPRLSELLHLVGIRGWRVSGGCFEGNSIRSDPMETTRKWSLGFYQWNCHIE